MRKLTGNKKGIDTILAALLMVVIVVVASVMVYAWSTGLLSSLLVQNPVPKETLQYDSASYGGGATSYNITIYVRNAGAVATTLQTYYVKDINGNQYTSGAGWNSTSLAPNTVKAIVICTINNGAVGGNCPSYFTGNVQPTYSGGTTQGFGFAGGSSYTFTLVTTRNNQFTWSFTK
jgi:hypothetical protein